MGTRGGLWIRPVILFALLAAIYLTGTNQTLFILMNRFGSHFDPTLISCLTILGDASIAALFLLPFIKRRPHIVWSAVAACIAAAATTHLLKAGLGVLRPPAVLDRSLFTILGPAYRFHSFPSGHAATIATLFGVFLMHRNAVPTIIAYSLIGSAISLTRVAAGVHWPLDIVAGMFIGHLAAIFGIFCVRFRFGQITIARHVWAVCLLANGVWVLFFHKTGFLRALPFQRFLAALFMCWGLVEYASLWIPGPKKEPEANALGAPVY